MLDDRIRLQAQVLGALDRLRWTFRWKVDALDPAGLPRKVFISGGSDAHGDFNTLETTPSGLLIGMPLAMLVGRLEMFSALVIF